MAKAGMWRGILAGYQDVEAKRMAREAKEEELLERRKALALEFAMKYGTVPGASSGSGAPGTSSGGGSIEHQARVLRERFGVSDEVIQEVAGSGPEALSSVIETLDAQRLRFENDGLEFPTEQVSNIMDTLVLTPSRQGSFDFSQLESYIGQELDPLEREMIQRNQQTAGSIFIPEPAYTSPVEIKDINELESRALDAVRQRGTIETGELNRALNQLNQAAENTSDANNLAAIQNAITWISDRQLRVNDALSSASGDQGNPFGLVNLYGNQFFQDMFQRNPRLQGALLSPIFQEAVSPQPKQVDSLPTLAVLKQLGLANEGEEWGVYNPQTQTYDITVIGE